MAGDGSDTIERRYTREAIAQYEAIYGRNFISPGGARVTAEILARVEIDRAWTVLDVGCGLGGAAFYLARTFGAEVHGIDLSSQMIAIAGERLAEEKLADQVRLIEGDCVSFDFSTAYDLIHSRDTFLHIHDKRRLFGALRAVTRPGGTLLFTDYCRGDGAPSSEFRKYVERYEYCLHTVSEYEGLLAEAGYTVLTAEDQTAQFIEIHQRELASLPHQKLSASDRVYLEERWQAKIGRAQSGEQRWALFLATLRG